VNEVAGRLWSSDHSFENTNLKKTRLEASVLADSRRI